MSQTREEGRSLQVHFVLLSKIDFVIKWNCSLCHPNWNWKRCDARDFNAFFSSPSFFCRFPTKLLGSIYCIINNKKLGIFSTDFSQDFLVWKRPRRAGQKNISSCINAWPICRLKLCMSISHDLIDKSVKYFGYILIWYPGIQLWKKFRIMTFSHLTHF